MNERMAEWGEDLVFTSAHFGARPTHAVWQGKVYSVSGTSSKYPSLVEATGYGTVTGLCGINCRHTMTPYVEGLSKLPNTDYSAQEQLTGMSSDEYYHQVQKQRAMERRIREFKRERAARGLVGLDTEVADRKIRAAQQRLALHVKQNKLVREYDRERAWGIRSIKQEKFYKKQAGALDQSNDPGGKLREKHAELYYKELENRGLKNVAKKIASNTRYRAKDIETILSHVILEKHHLDRGFIKFDPDYDMAQSFQRLIDGTNIQKHDLTMLDHEMLEHFIMLDNGNVYLPAHRLAEKCYNYQEECDEWKIRRK